jgi:hypothetical protein
LTTVLFRFKKFLYHGELAQEQGIFSTLYANNLESKNVLCSLSKPITKEHAKNSKKKRKHYRRRGKKGLDSWIAFHAGLILENSFLEGNGAFEPS